MPRRRLLLIASCGVVLCVLAAAVLWWHRSGSAPADLAQLQQQIGRWSAWTHSAPLRAAAAFVALYVLVAALSIPLAPLLGLAGGALFGVPLGLLLVLLSRTLGATLAAALVRRLLRQRLRQRYQQRMQVFDDGVRRDGAWYLLSLRLFPVMPFTLVNILAGLSAMPLRTFGWVSLLGMLPAAAFQVLAGSQLAQLRSIDDALQPPWAALLVLATLALCPLLLRACLRRRGRLLGP